MMRRSKMRRPFRLLSAGTWILLALCISVGVSHALAAGNVADPTGATAKPTASDPPATQVAVAPGLTSTTAPTAWLESLPSLAEIQSMELTVEKGGQLALDDFAAMLSTSRLLRGDDPLVKGWHYAPLCRGRFSTGITNYRFVIYRGGLARIASADGRATYVKFK